MTTIRMAFALCTVKGIPAPVRLCWRCHELLRKKLTSSNRVAKGFSCDACTAREKK